MVYRFILFLVLNFGFIGLSRYLGGAGPKSDWYLGLETAPWSPSGIFVALCWMVVLVCFSIYLAYLWPLVKNKNLLLALLVLHYILTLVYNPTFFYYHQVLIGLFIITALTIVIGSFIFFYWPEIKFKSLLVAPYFIWLLIATSLNAYILLKN
ncbi:tryptophan-rich sensory protein [Aequorivita sp. H23M31]|uniref:Tryptophan-rich sensory protein n=1 Tax=Aequorivita ciconiae TaxID=2494375 RepID=A0A410FZX8_9FLAO|nr:TspO/MBR family protein [Aequorivita sp. H23M31]QAA80543.1 tryptophan-rich sensory protein [Aequorivita sp. H23M31]